LKIKVYFVLKNMVLPRDAGYSMGYAYSELRKVRVLYL